VLEAQEVSGSSQRVGPPGRSIMRTGQAACERYREISCFARRSHIWSAETNEDSRERDTKATIYIDIFYNICIIIENNLIMLLYI